MPIDFDLGWRHQAPHAFEQHIAGDNEEQQRVERGGKNFEAAIAEGAGIIGRALPDLDRRQRDGERRNIGQHMRRIRQQREAVEGEGADDFDDKEAAGE